MWDNILCEGVGLVLWTQISPLREMMRSCTCFPYVTKMTTQKYKLTNRVIIKNAIILKNYIIYLILLTLN